MILAKETIVPEILKANNTTYLTHNFHLYSAKFIPQLPRIMIKKFTKIGDTIMDPFCGSGTTLVEAKLTNRDGIGIDSHPIGVLISKVKSTKIPEENLNLIPKILDNIKNDVTNFYKDKGLSRFINENRSEIDKSIKLPEFPNRDHWFKKHVLYELAIIKNHIIKIRDEDLKNFLLLGFSAIINQVSNQESETRYAAINKNIPIYKTFQIFIKKIKDMSGRMYKFDEIASDSKIDVYLHDTRFIDFLKDDSVDFIVTSPPYPNTYDYYLYHKQRMYWLDSNVKKVQDNEIGSRHKHSSKKEDVSTYMRDMIKCFEHFNRVLKNNKYFVFVVGDSIIRGEFIDGLEITKELSKKTGFSYVEEINYSLNLISRTFNSHFRNKTKNEHIILLRNRK